VRDLFTGPKRFKDFERSLSGVSTRTLSKKLSLLTEHGIIDRAPLPGKPLRVAYCLTDKGHGLHEITEAMRHYGTTYLTQ
jgi:DNA-binding HxlR family transcriptional regulator